MQKCEVQKEQEVFRGEDGEREDHGKYFSLRLLHRV